MDLEVVEERCSIIDIGRNKSRGRTDRRRTAKRGRRDLSGDDRVVVERVNFGGEGRTTEEFAYKSIGRCSKDCYEIGIERVGIGFDETVRVVSD
jgi:hypothetical protein